MAIGTVFKCTGNHEVFSRCGNYACQKTCYSRHKHDDCEENCVPGCVCEKGFVRNKHGNCVPYSQCGMSLL